MSGGSVGGAPREGERWGWVCSQECQEAQGYGHHEGCEYRDPVAEIARLRECKETAAPKDGR